MNDDKTLLLHVCCAPDATVPLPALIEEGYAVACYFYGSNIHPEEEYRRRLEAVRAVAEAYHVRLLLGGYAPDAWRLRMAGLENEPEGGRRCASCFHAQLKAAAEAARGSAAALCTTLTISPHKDPILINAIGKSAAESAGLRWIERVWRKNDGFKRSIAESERLGLYRQNYCGCEYAAGARAYK